MSRLKIKPRKFKAQSADIPNLADAVFEGDHEMPGWVIMAVNKKGRECVEALFPRAHIAWRDAGPSFPADWQGFKSTCRMSSRKPGRISCRTSPAAQISTKPRPRRLPSFSPLA